MQQIYTALKSEPPHHLVIALLFVTFILVDPPLPEALAPAFTTVYAQVIVLMLALIILVHTNAVIGVLAFVAAYFFIRRSKYTEKILDFLPSEKRKLLDFAKYNDFAVTLEEQVVDKFAPVVRTADPANSNFKPKLACQHDAAPIDYKGVN